MIQGVEFNKHFSPAAELTELNHPDHTLITYPDLGHALYPSNEWVTSIGQIPHYVLADLYAWLEAHSGLSHPYATPTTGSQSAIFELLVKVK